MNLMNNKDMKDLDLYIALAPKKKYNEDWVKVVENNVYHSFYGFYDEYLDGILINIENFVRLFNDALINNELYWITKVYVKKQK